MAFEVYKPRGGRNGRIPMISLSKSSIVLNRVAREKLNSNNIEMAYDRENNIVRIKASENGIPLKKTKVFGKGFFNQFGISKKGKFKAEFNQNERALYVNLNQQ